MKKIITFLVLGLFFLNISAAKALEVTDVSNSHWAAAQIANVLNKGFMTLKGTDKFSPEDKISRAEFVHSLLKVMRSEDLKAQGQTKFKDVTPQTPFDESILTSEQLKLVIGYPDLTFKPAQPILRSESTCVIANVTKGFYGDINVLERFADKDEIPNWAMYSYIKNTVHNLYINQPETTYLRPNDYLTRAEAAVLFTEVEKQLNLVEDKYKKTANKVPSEFLGVNTLKLVEGAPRNTVGLYNTKNIIEAGNIILANPKQRIETKNVEYLDQLVFEAPADVYTEEGTFLYPQGTKFIADVQKVTLTTFRHKKHKDLIVLRKLVLPSGISHQMAGVAYTTDKGKIVTLENAKKNPIKENYFEGARELTKGEFLIKYTEKLSPLVKYNLKVDETVYILLTGDMVIPNENYWEFEANDL